MLKNASTLQILKLNSFIPRNYQINRLKSEITAPLHFVNSPFHFISLEKRLHFGEEWMESSFKHLYPTLNKNWRKMMKNTMPASEEPRASSTKNEARKDDDLDIPLKLFQQQQQQ